MRVAAFTLALERMRRRPISRSFLIAAQCSAVVPSPCALLMSAPCLRRRRTASMLSSMAAVGRSCPAAGIASTSKMNVVQDGILPAGWQPAFCPTTEDDNFTASEESEWLLAWALLSLRRPVRLCRDPWRCRPRARRDTDPTGNCENWLSPDSPAAPPYPREESSAG
jgi:hypothetical protein